MWSSASSEQCSRQTGLVAGEELRGLRSWRHRDGELDARPDLSADVQSIARFIAPANSASPLLWGDEAV
jgi:hypothetical protein